MPQAPVKIFKWNLNVLANLIVRMCNNKFDALICFEGKRGCLTEDTEIITSEGIKQIRQFKPSDRLISYDFKRKKQIPTYALLIDKGIKQVFEIRTDDGRRIQATGNHIFYVKRKRKILELPLKDLILKDKLICFNAKKRSTTKIETITKLLKKEKVYDFKVPIYNNFLLANKILVHNCGKSTMAYQLARRIQRVPERIKGTYKFIPERDILYKQQDVLKAINTRWRSMIFCDEMVASAFNRDFYQEAQKKLIKGLNIARDHCNIVFMCIPSFSALDTQVRSLCKIRITVVKRGYAIIHTPIKSIYSHDVWDSVNNIKVEQSWTTRGVHKPKYSRLSTFRGVIKFPDLSPIQRDRYERIKIEKRNQILLEEIEGKEASEKGFNNRSLARQLATAMENGMIKTRQEFDKMCLVLGTKPSTMTVEVRNYNRDRGIDMKMKDYFDRWNLDGTEIYKLEEQKKKQTISPDNFIPAVLREN